MDGAALCSFLRDGRCLMAAANRFLHVSSSCTQQLRSEARATCSWLLAFSRCFVQFSSVLDDVYALGKAHMPSTTFLRTFPKVAFETVPRVNAGLVVDGPLSSFQ